MKKMSPNKPKGREPEERRRSTRLNPADQNKTDGGGEGEGWLTLLKVAIPLSDGTQVIQPTPPVPATAASQAANNGRQVVQPHPSLPSTAPITNNGTPGNKHASSIAVSSQTNGTNLMSPTSQMPLFTPIPKQAIQGLLSEGHKMQKKKKKKNGDEDGEEDGNEDAQEERFVIHSIADSSIQFLDDAVLIIREIPDKKPIVLETLRLEREDLKVIVPTAELLELHEFKIEWKSKSITFHLMFKAADRSDLHRVLGYLLRFTNASLPINYVMLPSYCCAHGLYTPTTVAEDDYDCTDMRAQQTRQVPEGSKEDFLKMSTFKAKVSIRAVSLSDSLTTGHPVILNQLYTSQGCIYTFVRGWLEYETEDFLPPRIVTHPEAEKQIAVCDSIDAQRSLQAIVFQTDKSHFNDLLNVLMGAFTEVRGDGSTDGRAENEQRTKKDGTWEVPFNYRLCREQSGFRTRFEKSNSIRLSDTNLKQCTHENNNQSYLVLSRTEEPNSLTLWDTQIYDFIFPSGWLNEHKKKNSFVVKYKDSEMAPRVIVFESYDNDALRRALDLIIRYINKWQLAINFILPDHAMNLDLHNVWPEYCKSNANLRKFTTPRLPQDMPEVLDRKCIDGVILFVLDFNKITRYLLTSERESTKIMSMGESIYKVDEDGYDLMLLDASTCHPPRFVDNFVKNMRFYAIDSRLPMNNKGEHKKQSFIFLVSNARAPKLLEVLHRPFVEAARKNKRKSEAKAAVNNKKKRDD